jgi:hypothetical protein
MARDVRVPLQRPEIRLQSDLLSSASGVRCGEIGIGNFLERRGVYVSLLDGGVQIRRVRRSQGKAFR